MKIILRSIFVLLGVMLEGASSAWAQNVDGLTPTKIYDFVALAQQSTTINWGEAYTGSGMSNSPKYIDKINGTSLDGRFASASNNNRGWWLRNDQNKTVGLYCYGADYSPQLALCNMWNGDRMRITFVGTIKFSEANSAKVNNQFVTAGQEFSGGTLVLSAVRTGDVIIEGTGKNSTVIQKVEFYNAYNGSNNNFSVSFNNPPTQMNVGDTYNGNNANISPSYVTPTFTSSNEAVASVNEYGVVTALKRGTTTITAKLDVGPEGATYSQHKSAQFTVKVNNPNAQPKYAYDPAIEVYDLTGRTWNISEGGSAGYSFKNSEAKFISNPTDYELNNRIAIQTGLSGSWQYSGGLKNNVDGLRLIGISNLRDGDRVKVTFSGAAGYFTSTHTWADREKYFDAGGKVFYDIDNDGEQDCDEDATITAGTQVESGAWYTMLEAGHLDIAFTQNAVITKIEIYSDRKAAYIDTDKGNGIHKLTFDGTGQLLEKTAYIPGLKIEFSDANSQTEYIHITQSDKGPVACGEDPNGFKMVLQNGNKIPSTGTFYKFIPEVNGKLNIEFKALSVKYGDKIWQYKSSDETVTGDQCYYVMLDVVGNNIIEVKANTPKGNGAYVQNFNNGFNLVKGHTYYFYGWWAHSTDGLTVDNNKINGSCGVAKLISATYQPAFQMPVLAAVGTNGMTSFNGSACSPQVTISGNPTNLKFEVKRTSANISVNANDISLEDGYLKISSITYNYPNKDKAGVILVKATAAEGEHVFALTIPYSAAYNTDANGNSEGHTWNFTDQPLEIGNYYSDFYAISGISDKQKPTDEDLANASKNTRSTLYQEINKADGTTDWTYTYRQVGTNGTFKDPMFQNVYNMEGDNADMIWETEGLWFDTPSNKSAIMNETRGAANHSSATDPDRYVAILPDASGKSSFTIPGLKKDDRVRIYMGSGDGSSTDACFFNITNARDAVYRVISESDVYKAGGTYWDLSGTSYDYYASYHFFAKADGPMTFKMVGGSMTKIYKIEIYRGARRFTNGVLGERQYFHSQGDGTSNAMYMHLHHRGKGESLANGQHVSNEMVATSGNISANNITLTPNGNDLKWTVNEGAFGVAKMRLKCMEYNQKYVTDYADFNVTVGYKEKVNYPKTWDFTDMTTYSGEDISTENTKYPVNAADIPSWDDAASYDLSMWDADGKMIVRNPTATDNSQEIFTQNKNGNGNQLYANDKIIPETKGLWFYFDNNDPAYSGSMQITTEGLRLANTPKKKEDGVTDLRMGWWNYKMVIPNVPSKAAVYLRVKRVAEVDETYESTDSRGNKSKFFNKKYRFDHMPTYDYTEDGKTKTQYVKYEIGAATTEYEGNTSDYTYDDTYTQYSKYYQANDGSGDYIIAVYNWGGQSNLTFTLNGFVLKKLAVSSYKKELNDKGWATECRNDVIDPALTGYMTGKDMRTYIATTVDFPNKKVTLLRIDKNSQEPEFKGYLMDKATAGGDDNACIIRNVAVGDENPKLQILDGGFHLFVPDMHDYNEDDAKESKKMKWNDGTNLTNKLVSVLNQGTIKPKTGEMTNYAFTCKYVDIDPETGKVLSPVKTGDQAFYRIAQDGAWSTGNQAYLPIEVPKPATSRALEASAASAESTATPLNFSITLANRSDVMTNLGDVNADGTFNQTDVESMTKYVTGRQATPFFKGLADINGDGVVDIVDVTRLIRKLGNE